MNSMKPARVIAKNAFDSTIRFVNRAWFPKQNMESQSQGHVLMNLSAAVRPC